MADARTMNKGVQILLERMSSNPDEFIPDIHGRYPTKWSDMMMGIQMRASKDKDYKDQLPFLNDWEIEALWRKMHEIQGELFVKQVMNRLLQDADANPKELLFDYANTAHSTYPTTIVPLQSLTTTALRATLNNLSPRQQEELSSLSRQVAGGSPKGKI
jgi:hypothetical protein